MIEKIARVRLFRFDLERPFGEDPVARSLKFGCARILREFPDGNDLHHVPPLPVEVVERIDDPLARRGDRREFEGGARSWLGDSPSMSRRDRREYRRRGATNRDPRKNLQRLECFCIRNRHLGISLIVGGLSDDRRAPDRFHCNRFSPVERTFALNVLKNRRPRSEQKGV